MKFNMKRKYITFLITIVAIGAVFFVAYRFKNKTTVVSEESPKPLVNVAVQSAGVSASLTQEIEYPGIVVGDQEIKVTAKSAGTVQQANFDLGDKVAANANLVKIDDTGNNLEIGDEGFRSSQVQQDELSVEQAEEQLELNKKTYKKLWNAYQAQKKNPDLTKTVSKTQLIAAKGQIEISEVQLESAKVGLRGGLDDHLITSPISGYVTSKSVSVGDSISLGQELYTISKTSNMKIQFFVDQEQLASIVEGMQVNAVFSNGDSISATVKNISPEADESTKRILIEVFPDEQESKKLISGAIVTISFPVTTTPQQAGNLILPITAVTVGQNENYVFISENEKAKKIAVQIIKIEGEKAEIKTNLPSNAMIIVEGNKLISEGEEIKIKN